MEPLDLASPFAALQICIAWDVSESLSRTEKVLLSPDAIYYDTSLPVCEPQTPDVVVIRYTVLSVAGRPQHAIMSPNLCFTVRYIPRPQPLQMHVARTTLADGFRDFS